MIHSNTPPAQIVGRRWWKQRRLAAMVPGEVAARHRPTHNGPGPWHPTIQASTTPIGAAARESDDPTPPEGVDLLTGEITGGPSKEMTNAR